MTDQFTAAPAAAPQAGTPEAMQALAAAKADPAFIEAYLSGDEAAKAKMTELQTAAHPGHQPDDVSARFDVAAAVAGAEQEGMTQDIPPPEPPPASPSLYKFDYMPGEKIDAAVDAEVRGLMHEAALPQSLASYLFKEASKITALPDPATIELQKRSAEFQLRTRWGSDYDAKLAAAKSVLKSLPPAKYARAIAILDRTGLGNNVLLVARLAALGEQRAAVRGKK